MRLLQQSHVIRQPYTRNITGLGGVVTWDGWGEMLREIELAGRVCYQSEARGNRGLFIRRLVRLGHHSVLEHGVITVHFTTDRGVSHELVRHRLASYSQESTRYCDYLGDASFIIPSWFEHPVQKYNEFLENGYTDVGFSAAEMQWMHAMMSAERQYTNLRKDGCNPQMARAVLPNSLKTSIVVSANPREWRHILALRTSKAAHPDIRALMLPLLADLKRLAPPLFEDINPSSADATTDEKEERENG